MLIELCAAGCRFVISLQRIGRPPDNLVDLDLRDPLVPEVTWTVDIRQEAPVREGAASFGWSGSEQRRSLRGDGFDITFCDRTAAVRYGSKDPKTALAAIQLAIFGALRREGRADLHASAIVPPDSSRAVVLVGESGRGKSTLTLKALSLGWGFLSDDLIAVFSDRTGTLALSPLRRTLRVPESAISLLAESARSEKWTDEAARKMIVDPETCGMPPRHHRAQPFRLVFLERGGSRRLEPLSSGAAFERLMLHSLHLAFDPDGKSAIGALKRLAEEVPACTATLPLDSLHDAATLEGFLA